MDNVHGCCILNGQTKRREWQVRTYLFEHNEKCLITNENPWRDNAFLVNYLDDIFSGEVDCMSRKKQK